MARKPKPMTEPKPKSKAKRSSYAGRGAPMRKHKDRSGTAERATVVPFKPKVDPETPEFTAEVPPEHMETEREGYAAWRRISSASHYADHCKVRDLLRVYSQMAMQVSLANSNQSPLYKKAFRSILLKTKLAALLDQKNESYRVRLLQLTPDVDAWHAALPEHEKIKNNYPGTVLANYRRHLKAAAGAADEREAAKAAKDAKAEEEARIAANNARVNAEANARAEAAEAELEKIKANGGNDASGAAGEAAGAAGGAGDASGGDPNTIDDLFAQLLNWAGNDRNVVLAVYKLIGAWLKAHPATKAAKKI